MKISEFIQTEPKRDDPKAERKRWRIPRYAQDQLMRDVYDAYWNLAVPAHLDAYNRNLIEIDPLPPILLGGPTTMDKDPIEGLAHEMNAHYTEFLEELDYLLDPRNDTKPGTFGTPPPGETTP